MKSCKISVKNPEIPILKDHILNPQEEFWNNFPKAALPMKANSRIAVKELEDMLLKNEDKLKKQL